MKAVSLLSLIFCLLQAFFLNCYDPLLVVVLMVKNEEHVICETLQPFVGAKYFKDANNEELTIGYLIFDTGSTDNTIPVVEKFLKKNQVNYVIKQEPFIPTTDCPCFDFAKSRNRGLELAEEAFPNAAFMLMPDAEWYIKDVPTLLKFCDEHQNNPCPSYLMRIMNTALDFYTPRLVKCSAKTRFTGGVHEIIDQVSTEKVPPCCYFELRPSAYGQEKSRQRWRRDAEKLFQEYQQDPTNPRTVFYLAQTYACLGNFEKACYWYSKRCEMPGWEEENFMARYKLALAYEALGKWQEALPNLLQAYNMRPSRIEPLIILAAHYNATHEYQIASLFAKRAVEISYPDNDILFIEKHFYDYVRYDLLSCAAWYAGDYEAGEKATKKALEIKPDNPQLHVNLAAYLLRKQTIAQ